MRNSAPLKARLLLLFLVLMAIFISVEAKIECRYVASPESCLAGETSVLPLSDIDNAHVGQPGAVTYQNSICCTEITQVGPISAGTPGFNTYLSISGLDNAHVAYKPDAVTRYFSSGYGTRLIIQNTATASCKLYDGTAGYPLPSSDEGCVVALSTTDNAHVASCDSPNLGLYPNRVYSRMSVPVPCGDGRVVSPEKCDPNDSNPSYPNLNGQTCATIVGSGSEPRPGTTGLSCNGDCTFNRDNCTEPAAAGNDVLSITIKALGKVDLEQDWSAENSEERISFEKKSAAPFDEIAYVAVLRNLTGDTVNNVHVKVELYSSDGTLIETPYDSSTLSIAPGTHILTSFSPGAPFGGSAYTKSDLANGNYYFSATVEPVPADQYIGNNASTANITVGSEARPVSVPDNDLLLVPLIAFIVLGILVYGQKRQNKGKNNINIKEH